MDVHSYPLRNPSGCADVIRLPRLRVYRVTAVDQAGARHTFQVLARNHADVHQQAALHIGSEPAFLSCCYDPDQTRAMRCEEARDAAAAAQAAAQAAVAIQHASSRPVRIDQLARPARPSIFGPPTDLDAQLDQIDSELEHAEHRHDLPHRRAKLLWLACGAAIGIVLWTLAVMGLGALIGRDDVVDAPALSSAAPGPGTH